MNVKSFGVIFVLFLIWVTYWECTKDLNAKKKVSPPPRLMRRLRRMLQTGKTPRLCVRHTIEERRTPGKLLILDSFNCDKCKKTHLTRNP